MGVTERLLPFSLRDLARDVLDRHALPRVYHHTRRQSRDFRHIQLADKIVVDFKLLLPMLTQALRLMNDDLFHKLI